MIGGRKVHPATAVPGGMTKGITEEQRAEIEKIGRWSIEFAQFSLQASSTRSSWATTPTRRWSSATVHHRTYYMGLVDPNKKVNFYDGQVSIVARTAARGHLRARRITRLDRRARRALDLPQVPVPEEGRLEGLRRRRRLGRLLATPLSRLNTADGMATPLAQAAYEQILRTPRRSGKRSTTAWPRTGLAWSSSSTRPSAWSSWRPIPRSPRRTFASFRPRSPTEGVGTVEAPRGTLTHHYVTDERGVLTSVNLLVGTTNNYAPMGDVGQEGRREPDPARARRHRGSAEPRRDGLPAYDPCFGCATHSLPGEMPLQVAIRNSDGEVIEVLSQNC